MTAETARERLLRLLADSPDPDFTRSDAVLRGWVQGLADPHGALPESTHTFVPQRHSPARCRPCGRRQRHTTHTPLWWDQVDRQESS